MTPVLDSGGGISGKLAKTLGPFSYQGSEVPDMAIPSTPSRKTLLVPTPLPSGSDSTFKLLQECYEACRTWGSSSGPPLSWVAAGGGGGFGCVANDPETFLARETPSAFQTPMAI